MKRSTLLFAVLVTTLLSSCLDKQYIRGKNKFASIERSTQGVTTVNEKSILKPESGFFGEVEVKDDYVIITTKKTTPVRPVGTKTPVGLTEPWQTPLIDDKQADPPSTDVKYYYKTGEKTPSASLGDDFKYWSFGVTLQSLAIPFKIRPGLDDTELGKIPPQGEAGFTIALAGGYKINHNTFKTKKNIFDKNVTTFSVTPGLFIGSGTADLTDKTTSGPVIAIPRKAVLVSTGGFLMFGADKFNIGYGIGFDNATGPGRKEWIYKGKAWHAIVVGIEIIK